MLTTPSRPAVGIRVDAGGRTGVGHAVRCLALAQELRHRGASVTVHGRIGVAWVRASYDRIEVPIRDASELSAATITHAVLDGYELPPSLGTALRDNGVHVTTIVDDRFGADQVADLYVDHNFGAHPHTGGPEGSVALAGARYALFRDDIRSVHTPEPQPVEIPRVLAVFGGTDPYGASDTVVPLLLATGEPMHLLVLCPDPERAERLRALPRAAGQTVEVVGAIPDIARAAAAADLAISAAGSTVWELLTIGTPTALVCVVDNQEVGYRATTEAGLVLPAGRLGALAAGDATERRIAATTLHRLITDVALRKSLRESGMQLFDGRGRERVADAMGVRKPAGSA